MNTETTPTETKTSDGRVIAVGDIHGCDVALETLLHAFELTSNDQLVVLGDAVDRGPETRRVLDLLLEVGESSQLIFVMGNHEEMMLNGMESKRERRKWLQFGGKEALLSYGNDLHNVPPWHVELMAKALPYYTTDTEVFIHASLQPGVGLESQSPSWLRWARLTGTEEPLPCGRRVICGHTPQASGIPYVGVGWVCIDTLAYGGGALTALDVTNDLVYQAQQSGAYRGGIGLSDLVDVPK